jgi:hypothetical protein
MQAAEGEYLMYRPYAKFTTKLFATAKSAPKSLNEG